MTIVCTSLLPDVVNNTDRVRTLGTDEVYLHMDEYDATQLVLGLL